MRQASGSTFPNLRLERLRSLVFPLPPRLEQNRIIERIRTLLSLIDETEKATRQAEKILFDIDQAVSLRAFSGKLVPQNSRDEPVSVLLKRISRKH